MGIEILALLAAFTALAALAGGAATPGRPWQRRRLGIGRRRRRLGLKIGKVFGSGEVVANVAPQTMMTMPLDDIPDGRVSFVVDVEAEGDDVNARGRFRANVDTGADGVSTIVFGAIMPSEPWRMLGLSEYLVDATRGTVGMVGFGFYGSDTLSFNVRAVETSGPYRVTINWRGIER